MKFTLFAIFFVLLGLISITPLSSYAQKMMTVGNQTNSSDSLSRFVKMNFLNNSEISFSKNADIKTVNSTMLIDGKEASFYLKLFEPVGNSCGQGSKDFILLSNKSIAISPDYVITKHWINLNNLSFIAEIRDKTNTGLENKGPISICFGGGW